MIMRSWHNFFFCLLTTAIYLVSKSMYTGATSSRAQTSSLAQFHLLGRRPMRDLRILHSIQQYDVQKIKVPPKETMIYKNQPDSFPKESASVDDEQELVYHIDYHGVTTHPNPTPKHPGP